MSVQTTGDDNEIQSTTNEQQPAASISKDDAFHLLQNARRRAVLRYMGEHDAERFRMRDLAEEVAAWEHGTTVQQLSSDERQRVYIALYQSHLPKLDDHGIIAYNQARGIVEKTPLTAVLDPYLEAGLHASADLTVEPEETERQRTSFTDAVTDLFR